MTASQSNSDLEKVSSYGRPDVCGVGPIEKMVKSRWEKILNSARQEYLKIPGHVRFGVQVTIGFLENGVLHTITRELIPDDDVEPIHKYYLSSSANVEKLFSPPESGIGAIRSVKKFNTTIGICFLTCQGDIDNKISERLLKKHFREV